MTKKKVKSKKLSNAAIRRISVYYRTLNLLERKNIKTVTSMELAEIEGQYSAIVRKDLSHFGCFGLRGVGYDVGKLKKELAHILGVNRKWGLVVIGAGQYSEVLMNSQALKDNNFSIKKIFEKNSYRIKNIPDEVEVFHINQIEEALDPEEDSIVIIALPPPEVQAVIDRLGKIGVKAALYLASRSVKAPENMIVSNHDVSIELGMLTYRLNEEAKRPS